MAQLDRYHWQATSAATYVFAHEPEKPALRPGSKGQMNNFTMISDGLFYYAHIPCMQSAE